MKKWLSLALALVLTALLLAGCGGVKGAYAPASGRTSSELSSIRFDGKTAVFSLWGYSTSGTYSIQGDTLELSYELMGKPITRTIAFSQKGNSIFLDGVEFVKQSSGSGKGLVTALIVLVLLAVLAAAYLLLLRPQLVGKKTAEDEGESAKKPEKKGLSLFAKRARRDELFEDDDEDEFDDEYEEDEDDDGEDAAPVRRAVAPEQPLEDEAEDIGDGDDGGEPEDDGVRVWRPETEAEEPEDEETIPIAPDRCCVCGKSLDNGFTVLARLPSGEEARIDRNCHKALYVLSNTIDEREFDRAAGYLELRMNRVDPIVANSLKRFIAKEEARLAEEAK